MDFAEGQERYKDCRLEYKNSRDESHSNSTFYIYIFISNRAVLYFGATRKGTANVLRKILRYIAMKLFITFSYEIRTVLQ